MRHETLQFEPVRRAIYRPQELYAEYDASRPGSWTQTLDFRIYAQFLKQGGAVIPDSYISTLRALHDASMTQLTAREIEGEKVVAVMGGHRMRRDEDAYRVVAGLGRQLAARGFLVTTGGGPGAMEATHLGAALVGEGEDRHLEAIGLLAREAEMPEGLGEVIDDDGRVDLERSDAAHRWFAPVHELATGIRTPGRSVSVPTWHYGHEPSTPLATHIGKLFQNSIREDGLLAIATHGVVYAPGSAGTLQEIFQDAAQNFYETYGDRSSPMVLLGREYWTETFPVVPVLRALFTDRYDDVVLVTDDVDAAVEFILAGDPHPSRLERCLDVREQPEEY